MGHFKTEKVLIFTKSKIEILSQIFLVQLSFVNDFFWTIRTANIHNMGFETIQDSKSQALEKFHHFFL